MSLFLFHFKKIFQDYWDAFVCPVILKLGCICMSVVNVAVLYLRQCCLLVTQVVYEHAWEWTCCVCEVGHGSRLSFGYCDGCVCLSVYTSVQVESLSLLHIVVGLSSSSSSLSAVVDDGRRRQNLVIKPFWSLSLMFTFHSTLCSEIQQCGSSTNNHATAVRPSSREITLVGVIWTLLFAAVS